MNAAERLQAETLALLARKNAAYGVDNIALTGLAGVVVRILDKAMRLKTLVLDTHSEVGDEALLDTLADLHGYALIGQLLERGEWPVDFEKRPSGLVAYYELAASHSKDGLQQEYFWGLADGLRIAAGETPHHTLPNDHELAAQVAEQ